MQDRTTRAPTAGHPLARAAETRDRLANQLAVTAGFVELLAHHHAIPPDLRTLADAARVETRRAVESVNELARLLDRAAGADDPA